MAQSKYIVSFFAVKMMIFQSYVNSCQMVHGNYFHKLDIRPYSYGDNGDMFFVHVFLTGMSPCLNNGDAPLVIYCSELEIIVFIGQSNMNNL